MSSIQALRAAHRRFRRLAPCGAALLCALAASTPSVARAQIGATTDIITGTVRAQNGNPLEGAQVEVTSLETDVTRRARTNRQGRYTILFPDGGGEYRVTFRAVGLAPATMELRRVADEDRLVADATLSLTTAQLSTVAVQARQTPRSGADLPTPGSVERAITPEQAARLPIDAADLLNLALMAPQVVSISATDSSAAGFSVGGLRPEANAVTLDGLSFGTTEVPQEAMRSTRVITSTYDVSRGQFSGGMIASTTRSGTNDVRGNFGYSLRDDELVLTGDEASPLAQGYTQNQFSGGIGRAILRDHLFAFGSFQLRRRDDVLPSLFNADAATLARLGVHADSVSRFFDIARLNGMSPGAYFDPSRLQDNLSTLMRLDWLMPNGHSLSLRADWRWSDQDPARVGTLALPQTGGTSTSRGGGLMATYTSIFGDRYLNELKAYVSTSRNEARGFVTGPFGRVQVASELAGDGTGDARAISTLTLGGNTGLPQDGRSRTFEMTDEVSWLTPNHRWKLGGLFNLSGFEQDVTTNRFGTYTFNSLADFEAGQAAMFTRTLQPNVRRGSQLNAALYLGDVWTPRRGLQLTYGARVEGGRFGDRPDPNPAVEASFGYRTDFVPKEVNVSPRVGFTWTIGGRGGPGGPGGDFGGRGGRGGGGGGRAGGGGGGGGGIGERIALLGGAGRGGNTPLVIRGGVGEFRSTVPTSLFSQAAAATGLANSEAQLVCTGPAVPPPDWNEFFLNPAAIPTECVGGGNAFVPAARPAVTLFSRDFEAPRAWRASLGAQRRIFERYNLNLDLNYSRGVAQTGWRDLNLETTPEFTVDNEGGRPVYVPATTIVPVSGATNLLASRRDTAFSQVLVAGSDLRSESKQMTISLNGLTGRGAIWNLGYTLGFSKDQSSGGGFGGFGRGFGGGGGGGGSFASATTAGNPNLREWSVSSFDRRHSITASLTWPINLGLEVTAFGRISSGAPFTPMVGGDVNGDGARNDRAFLFDPAAATTDPAVATAMTKLLATAPDEVAGCLQRQLGTVADRNSCRGVWQPSLELQVNWRPTNFGLNRRLMLSVTTQNLLGGLDELLHGSRNLHGWGVLRGQDNTLLYVRGFDPVTQRYAYEVNERFGATRQGANGISVPFQLGVNARLMVGPDRMRDAIDAVRGAAFGRGGRGGGAGGPGGPAAFAATLATFNPVAQIIQIKDTLALSAEQVTRLQVVADTLNAKNTALADEVRKEAESAGANPDLAALTARLRPRLEQLQRNQQGALQAAQSILTAEQWQRVPPRIRAGRGGGPGRGGRPPGG
ncbi:MAG TPA: carboxypeptidase-like regulatory domain-containing protein [Gemmatimonadaceae bacterium]|nr:carboxypeptidase-like regulatory domain-containing protein [Gemmatimonadaceae bacterium]